MTIPKSNKQRIALAIYAIAWVYATLCLAMSLFYLPSGQKESGPPERMVWTAQYDFGNSFISAVCLAGVVFLSILIRKLVRRNELI